MERHVLAKRYKLTLGAIRAFQIAYRKPRCSSRRPIARQLVVGRVGIYEILSEADPLRYRDRNGAAVSLRRFRVRPHCCGREQVVFFGRLKKNKCCRYCRIENLKSHRRIMQFEQQRYAEQICGTWFYSGRRPVQYLGRHRYEWECRCGQLGVSALWNIQHSKCWKCACDEVSARRRHRVPTGQKLNAITIIGDGPKNLRMPCGKRTNLWLGRDDYGTVKYVNPGAWKSGRTRSFMPVWKQRQLTRKQHNKIRFKEFGEAMKARRNQSKNEKQNARKDEKQNTRKDWNAAHSEGVDITRRRRNGAE